MRYVFIILLLLMSALCASAEFGVPPIVEYTYKGQTLNYYVYSDKTCAVAKTGGIKGDLIIPEYVLYEGEKYPVDAVISEALKSNHELTSIVVPNTVTYIGAGAFSYTAITSCALPTSITTIPTYLFEGCIYLTSFDIPDWITAIDRQAFKNCRSLTSISIPNSVTYIGSYAFMNCANLKSIELPYSFNVINGGAFAKSGLECISIPNSVSIIEDAAFLGCTNLKTVLIPPSVTEIQKNAFYECTALQSISIPSSVETIGMEAFELCDMDTINIGAGLKYIGDDGFSLGEDTNRKNYIINITAQTPPRTGSRPFPIFSGIRVNLQDTDDMKVRDTYKSDKWPYGFTEYGSLTDVTNLIGDNYQPIKGNPGQSFQLFVQVSPLNASLPMVFWESTNHAVATVDNFGKVTLTMPEDAKYYSGNIKEECRIIVSTMYDNGPTLEFKVQSEIIGVDGIILNESEWVGFTNEQFQLDARILPDNSSYKKVLWWSSDENIAAVDQNGLVTTKRVGECTIMALSMDGSNIDASCKVVVRSPFVELITLDPVSCEVNEKEDFIIKAAVFPEYAVNKELLWTSTDESIAVVDAEGMVTARNAGNVVIYAQSTDGSNVKAACNVTVKSIPVQSISITPNQWEGVPEDEFVITATLYPENATNKSIVWRSSDTWIAEVDAHGYVRALHTGETIITAECTGGSDVYGECIVTVKPILVESIVLNYESWTGCVGDVFRVNETVYPENAHNKNVIWSSSDETIAQVNQAGVVSALSPGEADIIATAVDGSNLSAICHVTVLPALVESIVLTPDSWGCEEGETFAISATVLPEYAKNKSLVWSSNDRSVATVDSEGLVTVHKEGTCVIKATAADGSGVYAECIVTGLARIEEIFANTDLFDVYDLNGILIKKDGDRESLKHLTSGIYIVRVGKTMKKLVIR